MEVPDRDDVALAERLAAAISGGRLSLEYQPKIALATGLLSGVEALTRWHDPELGRVPTGRFVAIAEGYGLIDALTVWLVDRALRQWSTWKRQGLEVRLALNVSALSLRRADFPDILEEACSREGVPPGMLTIEVTESASQQLVALLDTLTRIRLKGMGLALDDFGTGYSSLLQLRRLPYSELKIDQAFVRDAIDARESRLIIQALIDLAHAMGLTATAEGIENEETLALLRDWGCNEAQGYLISPPIAGAELPAWVADSGSRWRPLCLGQSGNPKVADAGRG